MKKIVFIVIVIVSFLIFSGCIKEKWNTDLLLHSISINNTLYNTRNSGHIAYADNCLYISTSNNKRIIEISNNQIRYVDTTTLDVDHTPEGPFVKIFNFNNELYAIPISDKNQVLMKYNKNEEKFVETDMGIKPYYDSIFLSDNLWVWKEDINNYNMHIKYNKKEYILNNNTCLFSVFNNVVYFISGDCLYEFSPKEAKPESRLLADLDDKNIHSMYVLHDRCYYLSTDGLYRYSFTEKNIKLISDKDVSNLNIAENKLFFSTKNDGIYYVEKDSVKKFSDIGRNSEGIICLYVVDDTFLYSYETNGEIYRISISTGKAEPVLTIGNN